MTLEIDGMHCEACVRRVTQALARVAPVESVRIGSAQVAASPQSVPALLAALDKAGFQARVEP